MLDFYLKKIKLKKIVNITSAHSRNDGRIFNKICKSLSRNYSVTLICADGKGSLSKEKIFIIDLGVFRNRFFRFIGFIKFYKKALKIDGDIYHLHDPDLILVGLMLIAKGKKVIFDSHEDIAEEIKEKYYIPIIFRNFISIVYKVFEKFSLSKFDGIIAATPYIKNKLIKINPNTIDVLNYPTLNRISSKINKNKKVRRKTFSICYIGSITKIRGIFILVRALNLLKNKVTLNLVGNFSPKSLVEELKLEKGWKYVNYLGYLNKNFFFNTFDNKIGVMTLLSTPNNENSIPTKLFDYMLCKIPVISSNIKFAETIIKKYQCGIIYKNNNPKSLAKKIDYLIENYSEAIRMGKNGYKAIINDLNWKTEEKKLIIFYKSILKS